MVIYFYKANDSYGCFSNFSLHPVWMDALEWPTVEHYYQAQKFVGTGDAAVIPLIHTAPTPEQAAALGRDRCRRTRFDWEQVKAQVMQRAVLTKFLTHLDIQAVLLSTGHEELVENSPTDYYWGCGHTRTGQNQLGRILMQVRDDIRSQSSVLRSGCDRV
jgi:ribA/ribD-fused uncharacterized protein